MGSEVLINAKTRKAVVVDRGALDREMAEAAANDGAEYRLRTGVYGIQGNTLFTRGVNGHEEVLFRLLIAADGPRSTLARLVGLQRAQVYLAGIQADMLHECDPRFAEIYPDASPEFFGWSIPTGNGRIRVGLCARTQVPERFKAFMKKFGTCPTHLVTGTLPLGVMQKTYKNRILFVGDAAGFAKPTSGGGVYTGIRSARHAAAVAVTACERDKFDDAALADYERRWKTDFGQELSLGYRFFKMRQNLAPHEIDILIRALNNPEMIRLIIDYGDMDRPGKLLRKFILRPEILKAAAPLIKYGVHSLFE
jgi:flavin-dependent dehydrogenase